jgi:hypothetical protein
VLEELETIKSNQKKIMFSIKRMEEARESFTIKNTGYVVTTLSI